MNQDLAALIQEFNLVSIKDYALKHNEDWKMYTPDDCQRIIESYPGCISQGAIYKWPRANGSKISVTGFGLIELDGKLWFIASYNSKKEGKPKIEKLDPDLVLRMIASGEIYYEGNIFCPEFRKSYDIEKLTLSILGFASLVYTKKLQQNISVDEIIAKLESGEMSLENLLAKCKTAAGQDLLL
jgi:hypothetical protein